MKFFIQTSLFLILGLSLPVISGAVENLDPDFGNNGQLTTEFSIYDDQAFAITVQPDGKILVAGHSDNGSDTDIAIARYLSDGSPDKSFNFTGQVTVAVGSGDDNGLALIVQEDGKILVAGTTDNGDDLDVAVIRLQSDGLPDMDFDQDGQVVIPLPDSDDRAQSVLVQKDGKIILAGSSEGKDNTQLFLARLNSDGSLDENFASKGLVSDNKTDADTNDNAALSAALQDDGRILLAGSSSTGEISRAALFSFLESGQVDETFGNNGISVSGQDEEKSLFYDLKILEDGRIRAAGATLAESYRSVLLAGFESDGNAEQTFGTQGIVQTDLGVDTVAYSLAIGKDGTIYLAGSSRKNQDSDFVLIHYSATGHALDAGAAAEIEEEEEEEVSINVSSLVVRDTISGPQGYTLTDFDENNDVARAIYIQDDGTILLAGSAENGKDSDFAVLRYSPEQLAKLRQSGGIYTSLGKYISTTLPSQISRNSATSGGYIQQHTRNVPTTKVTQRGVCYGVSPAPVWKDATNSDSGSNTDSSSGSTSPTTTTSSASSTSTSDNTGATPTNNSINVSDLNPFKTDTIREGCTTDGKGEGEFRSDLLNLTPDTTYYIRAYAILDAAEDATNITTSFDKNGNKITTTTNSKQNTINITVKNDTGGEIVTQNTTGTFVNGTVIYGNELTFKTKDACFIATAAFGDINKTQVTILRQFRDKFFKPSSIGRKLINIYYTISPPLADIISGNSFLQQITRWLLIPITMLSYFALHPLFTMLLFTTLLLMATLFQTSSTARHSVHRSPTASQGFTLIELLVVLVIIGILAGYVGPRIMGHPEEAKRTMASAQISALETAIESYKLDNGVYPSTEQGLQALVEAPSVGKLPKKWRKGGYMKKGKVPKDPWGNEYVYLSPGTHTDFDIISYGADNESGGEDADQDINNWEIE